MADGAIQCTQEEFDKIKAKLLEGIKTQEKSVAAVAGRVEDVLAFGVNHPSGEFLSEKPLTKSF
jgi:predicted Zn-dependent peptidase